MLGSVKMKLFKSIVEQFIAMEDMSESVNTSGLPVRFRESED
jgi:hypothetical protein